MLKLAKQPSKEREASEDDWKVDETSGSESESESDGSGKNACDEHEIGKDSEVELSASEEAKSDSEVS